MKSIITALFFITLSITKTCTDNTKNTNEKSQAMLGNTFFVETLNNKTISDNKINISFDKKESIVSGNSGCNTYSSKYSMKNTAISIEMPVATRMYCEDNMELEEEFLETLLQAKTISFSENYMYLKDKNNTIIIAAVQSKE